MRRVPRLKRTTTVTWAGTSTPAVQAATSKSADGLKKVRNSPPTLCSPIFELMGPARRVTKPSDRLYMMPYRLSSWPFSQAFATTQEVATLNTWRITLSSHSLLYVWDV